MKKKCGRLGAWRVVFSFEKCGRLGAQCVVFSFEKCVNYHVFPLKNV